MSDAREQTPDILIRPTHYGMFFLVDARGRVWDGNAWRGFGEAERYRTYRDAFKARHAARAALNEA